MIINFTAVLGSAGLALAISAFLLRPADAAGGTQVATALGMAGGAASPT